MQKRAIWIVTVFIILAIGYYWIVIDEDRTEKMGELVQNDSRLSGDVNSTVEVYDRLEKKWIGTSKHVQTLQQETHAHYKLYSEKVDSINMVFEEVKFSIDQLEELLTRKIDRVKEDVTNLEETFDSYKRSNNRSIREIKKDISTIKDDIAKLNEKVFPPAEEDKKKK